MKKRLLASVLCAAMAGTLWPAVVPRDSSGGASQAPAAGTEAKDRGGKNGGCKDRNQIRRQQGQTLPVVTEPTELIFIFADGNEGAKRVYE